MSCMRHNLEHVFNRKIIHLFDDLYFNYRLPMSLSAPFFFFSISKRSVVAFSYRRRHVRNFSSLTSADANSRHRSPSKEYLPIQEYLSDKKSQLRDIQQRPTLIMVTFQHRLKSSALTPHHKQDLACVIMPSRHLYKHVYVL